MLTVSSYLKYIHNNNNSHRVIIVTSRKYGVMELENKFGNNFKKIQDMNLENATPLERKMYNFVTKIQKSPTLNDKMIIHESEIVSTEEVEDKKENKDKKRTSVQDQVIKPNLSKIIQSSYNWNPYYKRTTNKNNRMQHDHLDDIPLKYKQSGWGMQPQSIIGSPQIYKQFPNTDILKNMISDGQRVFDIGHLLTNPLKQFGFRDYSISKGRDYNVLERTLQPFSSNIIEEWHGLQTINSQNEKKIDDDDDDKNNKINFLTKRQIIMRRLKKNAISSYENNDSLPPFKFGFEDIPIFTHQKNYHSPDKLGSAKRTRELKCKSFLYLKYIFPDMTKEQNIASKLICGKYYNEKTTKLTLQCTNHYFYKENEKQIIEWIGNIIIEIDRLSQYLLLNKQPKIWEEYKSFYQNEWKMDNVYKKWNKYRWKEKMLSLPLHLRSNYNLYQNGNRMNKLSKYLDLIYNKTFIDASNILQRQGPKKGIANEYYKDYIAHKYEIMDNNDLLPNNPSDYILTTKKDHNQDNHDNPFNIIKDNKKYTTKSIFGINSCYEIPSSDKQFENVSNAFNIPLSQPFTGLRLRKFKLTPWTNSSMMKLYRYGTSRLGMKLIFGDEQFKKLTLKKVEEIETERLKQKSKQKQNAAQQGRRRNRSKYQAKQHIFELKQIRKKRYRQKEVNEQEDNPLFQYLSDTESSKIMKTHNIHEL